MAKDRLGYESRWTKLGVNVGKDADAQVRV